MESGWDWSLPSHWLSRGRGTSAAIEPLPAVHEMGIQSPLYCLWGWAALWYGLSGCDLGSPPLRPHSSNISPHGRNVWLHTYPRPAFRTSRWTRGWRAKGRREPLSSRQPPESLSEGRGKGEALHPPRGPPSSPGPSSAHLTPGTASFGPRHTSLSPFLPCSMVSTPVSTPATFHGNGTAAPLDLSELQIGIILATLLKEFAK